MNQLRRHFGRLLRQARQARELSLADVSHLTGISPDAIARIEGGHTYDPSLRAMVLLASILGLDPTAVVECFIVSELDAETARRLQAWFDEQGRR